MSGKANTCLSTHTPNTGNCTELMGTSGSWESVSVSSVTPTTIVTQIPDATFGCVGTLGESVAVSKWNSLHTVKRLVVGTYCTNAAQP